MIAKPIPHLTPQQTARFWTKVNQTGSGCWEWTACRKESGYGQYSVGERMLAAHRVAYALTHGEPPAGLDLDHLCRNRACVNPDHLEPVTRRENLRRGDGHGKETHCPQGHAYIAGNVYKDGGGRKCATCVRARARRYYRANAEKVKSSERRRRAAKRAA